MERLGCITIEPRKMGGQPCIEIAPATTNACPPHHEAAVYCAMITLMTRHLARAR